MQGRPLSITSTNPMLVQLDFLGFNPPPPPPPPLAPPNPPSSLQGKQKKNDFGFEYELYNQLKWTPSPTSGVIGYFIYRDGVKIAEVDASTHSYQDHHRKRGASYSYAITAYSPEGGESSPINIVINP